MALIKNANSRSMARQAVVLDLGDLAAQGEFIKREARSAAEAIVREAREERKRILAGSREEGFAAGEREGLELGLSRGREQGRDEALAAHRAQLQALEARWGAALDAFDAAREDLLHEARRDVLMLACEVARRVTDKVVDADATVVVSQLERALALVLAPTRLAITVHPDDEREAGAVLPALMRRFGPQAHADLVTDAAVGRGSCMVRTDHGEIDASVRTQLQRAVDAVMGDHAPAPPEPGP